jgi:hypothetical protein
MITKARPLTTVLATSHTHFTLHGTWSGDQNEVIEKIERLHRVKQGSVELYSLSNRKAENDTLEGAFFCVSKEEDSSQIDIAEHYDTGGLITAESNAEEEFKIWSEWAQWETDYHGAEFTLSSFETHIDALKQALTEA